MTATARPHVGPVAEAPMRTGEAGGKVPDGPGWYVLNAADAEWRGDGTAAFCSFEGEPRFTQYGMNIHVLTPGTPNAKYHREYYEDESFLVLSGECTLVVEGEERSLVAGDFVFCPAGTAHVFIGAGTGRCAILMMGARLDPPDVAGCVYVSDPVATAHGAGVDEDTEDPRSAYAGSAPYVPIAEPWWAPAD